VGGRRKARAGILITCQSSCRSRFQKVKSKTLLKKNAVLPEETITSFGVIGQLSNAQAETPTTNASPSHDRNSGMEPMMSPKLATKHAPLQEKRSNPNTTFFFSGLNMSRSNESTDGFVVVPPALSYTDSGSVAPYESTTVFTSPALPYIPSTPQNLPETASPNSVKANETSKMPPLIRNPTSSVAVDMLMQRMTTEKGRQIFEGALGPLPTGWERRFDPRAIAYYVGHNGKPTSWVRPVAKQNSSTSNLQSSGSFLRNPLGHSQRRLYQALRVEDRDRLARIQVRSSWTKTKMNLI
jgi:hypothetical protein